MSSRPKSPPLQQRHFQYRVCTHQNSGQNLCVEPAGTTCGPLILFPLTDFQERQIAAGAYRLRPDVVTIDYVASLYDFLDTEPPAPQPKES